MIQPAQTDDLDAPLPAPIRMRTLTQLRWIAIGGQLAAVAAARLMGVNFAVIPVLLLIFAAIVLNSWTVFQRMGSGTPPRIACQLLFDIAQLSTLVMLTGGLSNPFGLLVLAPVTIAAATLNARQTIALAMASAVLITLAALLAFPLSAADGTPLRVNGLLAAGHWLALVVGVFFFSGYAHRVMAELTATRNALFATQLALAREQRLQHLGGVVAAAAHEMGTPLATIKLISSELADDLQGRPELADDLTSLRDATDRCAMILRNMGRAGKDDLLLRIAPLRAVIEDAAHPHFDRGPKIEILADGPDIRRDPAIVHALRNLIQNAVDFADKRVVIEAHQDARHLTLTIRDDGPGYPPALLPRIGDPYLTSRRSPQRKGYEGMGLGLFIAKTLLERSGARLQFANGGPGAMVRVRWPLDRLRADGRAPLGENPAQQIDGLDLTVS